MFNFYFDNSITASLTLLIAILTLIIQVVAFLYAKKEYDEWKSKTNSESEHSKLIQLFESVTKLKVSLIEFEKILEDRANFVTSSDPSNKVEKLSKLHHDIYDLYDTLVTEVLISTKTESQIINKIFELENVHLAVEELISHAEKEKGTLIKVFGKLTEEDPKLPTIKTTQKIDELYEKIKSEIKNSSKILG